MTPRSSAISRALVRAGLAVCIGLAALMQGGCITVYTETSAAGDTKRFLTTGNIGFTTDQVSESDSRSQGVPLLGGGFRNDKLTETTTFAQAGVTIGALEIQGPIDNSTPLDVGLGWVYRGVRAWITGEVFKNALDNFYGAKNAEVAAEAGTKGAEIEAGAAAEQARIAAEVEQARIAAEVETLNVGGPLP